jgi:hypothetical protein
MAGNAISRVAVMQTNALEATLFRGSSAMRVSKGSESLKAQQ